MTTDNPDLRAPANVAGIKHQGAAKTARIPIKVASAPRLPKPDWIRVRASSSPRFGEIKNILRKNNLHTVCEEASCPNIGECFSKGTATFMIMGDICTRRCPFCDVGHGRPLPLDADEPGNLARTIAALELRYVVITSVDRDDLRDGGARHFVDCIRAVREHSKATQIEVLVPDFRGRLDRALSILARVPARYHEPQPRDRAAPLQAGAAGLGLRALAFAAARLQGAVPEHSDQVRTDGWVWARRTTKSSPSCATCARTTSRC